MGGAILSEVLRSFLRTSFAACSNAKETKIAHNHTHTHTERERERERERETETERQKETERRIKSVVPHTLPTGLCSS